MAGCTSIFPKEFHRRRRSQSRRVVVANWPSHLGKKNMAFAFDPAHHRLYVGCRDTDVRGSILVVDTETGRELDRLPIGGWVDFGVLRFGKGTESMPPAGVGEVFTYERDRSGAFKALEATDTAVMAKTSLYSPQLNQLYVAVPHLGGTSRRSLFSPASDHRPTSMPIKPAFGTNDEGTLCMK